MATSEIQKEVFDLGEKIVQELSLEPSCDTLSKWMAHYIAELMKSIKSDEDKDRCYQTILELWERRLNYPSSVRPFESFEPVFQTLANLSDEKSSLEVTILNARKRNTCEVKDLPSDSQDWLDMAIAIDKAAKTLVKHSIEKACNCIDDKPTQKWFDNEISKNSDEVEILLNFISTDDVDDNVSRRIKERKRENLLNVKSVLEKASDLLNKEIDN